MITFASVLVWIVKGDLVMKKALLTLAAALVVLGAQNVPTLAFGIYEEATYPIVETMDEAVRSPKCGVATCKNVLGIVKWGDCSTTTAMRNGGITKVEYGDIFKKWIILYGEDTVKVYGK